MAGYQTNLSPANRTQTSSRAQYDGLRKHQLETFEEQLPAFLEAVNWSPEQLHMTRERRLRQLLAFAQQRSPWHAKRLAHIDTTKITEADLARIPTMTKTDLMENFDEIVTDPSVKLSDVEAHLAGLQGDSYFQRTSHAISSGGSSGARGVYVYDWDAWVTLGLSSARPIVLALEQSSRSVRQRAVAFVGGRAAHSSAAFTQSFAPWLIRQFDTFLPLPMSLPLSTIVEKLNEIQPTCLSGYPSFLYQLCFAATSGKLRINPKSILVGAETLLPEHQKALELTFGAKVFNFYGCSEASCIAFSCPESDALHLADDTAILEPVTKRRFAAPAGVASANVLLTNLFNTLLPLIRYELGDSVIPLNADRPCSCGSSFRKIHTIEGRSDDVFTYENGVVIHPFVFRSALGQEPIVEYQVSQTRTGAAVTVRVAGPSPLTAIATGLSETLRKHGLTGAVVSISEADKIERTPTGKLHRFIPMQN